mgnify:CR=1 FL=1
MADFKLSRGQLQPPVSYLIAITQGGLAVPYVLGDADVTFSLSRLGEAGLSIDHAPATVVNPDAIAPSDTDGCVVRYSWEPGDTDVADEYVGWFTLAGQDLPTVSIIISDRPPSTAGRYTSPAKLKDFTGIVALKDEDDEWLSENLIPRAEAWVDSLGPFKDGSVCSGKVTLATNVLAEQLYLSVSPDRTRGGLGGLSGVKKSETIGRYSYTLAVDDNGDYDTSRWDAMLDELLRILGGCLDIENMDAVPLGFSAGSTQVFPTIPGFEVPGNAFEAEDELITVRTRFHEYTRRVWRNVWWR